MDVWHNGLLKNTYNSTHPLPDHLDTQITKHLVPEIQQKEHKFYVVINFSIKNSLIKWTSPQKCFLHFNV